MQGLWLSKFTQFFWNPSLAIIIKKLYIVSCPLILVQGINPKAADFKLCSLQP